MLSWIFSRKKHTTKTKFKVGIHLPHWYYTVFNKDNFYISCRHFPICILHTSGDIPWRDRRKGILTSKQVSAISWVLFGIFGECLKRNPGIVIRTEHFYAHIRGGSDEGKWRRIASAVDRRDRGDRNYRNLIWNLTRILKKIWMINRKTL